MLSLILANRREERESVRNCSRSFREANGCDHERLPTIQAADPLAYS